MSRTERRRLDLASSLAACGVARTQSLEELLAPREKAAFLERPTLRLAHHFDLAPDILLIDPSVATLGMVHVLPGTALGKVVQERIDHATYVRHLLLTAPDRKDRLPYAVELILVAADSEKSRQAVAKALRAVARRTSYLHAIGVSELYHSGQPFDEDSLRRAFPWLLRATRTWLEGLDAGTQTSWKLLSLTLESYRLPGHRTLRLDPAVRFHLAHGHNGSGKSSIAEALELAMTGTVERLDFAGELDYEGVLTNRDAKTSAAVVLEVLEQPGADSKKKTEKRRGVARDAGQAFSPGIKATSFRLDQTLMDRLARMGDEKRAITFLESFFPKDHKTHEDYRQAEQRRARALKALDGILTLPTVAEGEALDVFLTRYAVVDLPQGTLDPEVFDQVLPLPLAALRELTRAVPGLRPQIEAWQTSLPPTQRLAEELARLDEELAKAAPDVLGALARLRPAVEILRGMRNWVARSRTTTGQDPAKVLNAWVELCALVDLAEKQVQLARSLAGARQKGWNPAQVAGAELVLKTSLTPADLTTLESCLSIWTRDRDRLAGEVRDLRRRAGPVEPALESVSPSPHLSDEQIAVLDAVGPWLLPSSEAAETAPFGKLINDAVTGDETLSYGDLPIGTPGWGDGLLQRLEPLLQACIQAEPVVEAPRAAERLRIFREAVQSHRNLQEEGSRVRSTFLEHIRPESGTAADHRLDHAINELMALFTPARHEEIGLAYRAREAGGSGELLFTLQKSEKNGSDRAELLFNTAELNIFTLALFLLCSVRIDNRLSLLVLDDPLQNMDEQTVTTVARGLARFARVLPKPWQILLLFHGEDDLKRFSQEVPCATYLLPWLAPAATETNVPEIIEPQPGNVSTVPQPLDNLLASSVPAA